MIRWRAKPHQTRKNEKVHIKLTYVFQEGFGDASIFDAIAQRVQKALLKPVDFLDVGEHEYQTLGGEHVRSLSQLLQKTAGCVRRARGNKKMIEFNQKFAQKLDGIKRFFFFSFCCSKDDRAIGKSLAKRPTIFISKGKKKKECPPTLSK